MTKASDIQYVVLADLNGNPYAVTSGSGGTSMTDKSAFTAGSNSATPIAAFRDDSGTSTLSEGEQGVVRATEYRALHVNLRDASGSEVSVGGGTQYDEDTASANGQKLTMAGVTRADTAASQVDTDGDRTTLIVDANGRLHVNVGNTVTVDGSGVTQPVSGTFWQATQPVSLASAVAVTDNSGSLTVDAPVGTPVFVRLSDGSSAIATLPVSLASVPSHNVTNAGTFVVQVDGTALTRLTDIETNTDSGAVVGNGAAATAQRVTLANDSTGIVALTTSTASIGKLAANSGVDIGDVDVTSIAAGTNLIGDVGIQPRTTNGLDTFMASGSDGSSILVATAQVVKASAGKLYGYYIYNPEAAVTFVHFYNTAAASVTVGTTSPLFTLPIPAGAAANLMSEIGITFSNAGWSVAATTTAGGNTAPSTGVSLVAWYK